MAVMSLSSKATTINGMLIRSGVLKIERINSRYIKKGPSDKAPFSCFQHWDTLKQLFTFHFSVLSFTFSLFVCTFFPKMYHLLPSRPINEIGRASCRERV